MTVASIIALAVERRKTLSLGLLPLLVVLYVGNAIRLWYRLRDFKGPFFAAFSKFWLLRTHIRQTAYLDVAAVCDKYGER